MLSLLEDFFSIALTLHTKVTVIVEYRIKKEGSIYTCFLTSKHLANY